MRSSGARAPDDDRGVAHGRVVERVERMAELPHHVVGDVDDVADRAQARPRADALAIHAGDGPTRTSLITRTVKRAQSSGRVDAHAREAPTTASPDSFTVVSATQRGAGERRQLARDPDDREAVGTVRGDLDLEHAVVEPEVRDEIGAERRVGGRGPGRRARARRRAPARAPSTASPATSTPRILAAPIRRISPAAARQHGAPAARRPPARPTARVRRAADTEKRSRPVLTRQRTSRCAVALAQLALDRLDLADDHARQPGRRARGVDTRHLDPALTSRSAACLGRQHRGSTNSRIHPYGIFMRPYANWRRKRRSFSKNSRMSSTPYFSIAIRSIPMPNAQPVNSSGS